MPTTKRRVAALVMEGPMLIDTTAFESIDTTAFEHQTVVPRLGTLRYASTDTLRRRGLPRLAAHLESSGFAGALWVHRRRRGVVAMFYVPRDSRLRPLQVYGSRTLGRHLAAAILGGDLILNTEQ
jgi:hypothetical protein